MQTSHANGAFTRDLCDCGSNSGTSDDSSEKLYEPDWVEKISPKGDLFYVEPSYQHPINVHSTATGFECNASQASSTTTKSSKSDAKQTLKSLMGKKKHRNSLEPTITDMPKSDKKNGTSLHDLLRRAECQEVYLNVDPKRHNYGRRATLCEALFGIIPGRLPSQLAAAEMLNEGAPIMVQGLLPDGEAMKSGMVKIGDVMKSIDDFDINEDNITFVLRNITKPQRVKVSLLRLAENALSDSVKFPVQLSTQQQSSLMKQLMGDRTTLEETKQCLRKYPHIFLYQELHSDSFKQQEPNSEDERVYQYPEYDSTLAKLRGMFVTLSSVIGDTTATKPRSSALAIEDTLVHVSYFHDANSIAILALPATCASAEQMQEHIDEIVTVIRLQYGSLSRAFRDQETCENVDRLFDLFFSATLTDCEAPRKEVFAHSLPCAAWLPLPTNIQARTDSVLSELESANFGDMSEAFYESQRLFTFVGSCLFYRGHLLASHLPKQHFLNVFLFCRHYQLLRLTSTECVGQLVVWREVFLPEPENSEMRHFLLVTGLKHGLLCALLEVGGCSAVPEAHPGPDLFYVDQAQNTLLQLELNGVLSAADTCIEKHALTLGPPAGKASVGKREKTEKSFSSTNLSTMGAPSPKRRTKNVDRETCQLLRYSSAHLDTLDNDFSFARSHSSCDNFGNGSCNQHCSASTGSDCESRTSGSDLRFGRVASCSYDLSSLRQSLEDYQNPSTSPTLPIVPTRENLIFHYLHVDLAEGIFVAPAESTSSLDAEILNNFNRSCLSIRKVLRGPSKTGTNEETQGNFVADKNFSSVKEYGVLFTCGQELGARGKGKQPTSYWVIGRLFPDKHQPREVYVCIHENASPSALETAFKLSFGRQL
ncbi:protein inturned-like [Ornithodoros turicata]|uniref:protein inturned-like n=1 Tax=Ornithodoros turicata TaxID=34597 RepID=UPI003138EC85